MALKHPVYQLLFVFAVTCGCAPKAHAASACVWKVTGPSGGTLYLGGSVHALRSSDYPLPPAYNRAFDASARLAFEQDPRDTKASAKLFSKTAQYPKGDSLKNHVDPRTYDYVRRVFRLMGIPEERFSRFRPWALVIWLWSPNLHGLSDELGIEDFLQRRARANSKPIFGLESFREHLEVLSGLSERQSEALLLFTFISDEQGVKGRFPRTVEAWRRGDADTLARMMQESFREFPAMGERMLGARNRAWIPKIEGYLRSGQTYFVVAGAGHMGGPEGLLALLRARGYKIEQL